MNFREVFVVSHWAFDGMPVWHITDGLPKFPDPRVVYSTAMGSGHAGEILIKMLIIEVTRSS